MTLDADTFAWSSARHHLGLHSDPFVESHPAFLALGTRPVARYRAWRSILDHGIERIERERIRKYTRRKHEDGAEEFQEQLSVLTGRSVKVTARGRTPART